MDWVSLPNTLGMSQHGDGGIVGTKPYVSTGNYINKMSNFCRNCRYDYQQATGDNACPITTREASSLQDAIRSAIGDINAVGYHVASVELQPDALARQTI